MDLTKTPLTDAEANKPAFSPSEWIKFTRKLEVALNIAENAVKRAFWIAEREVEHAPDKETSDGWQTTSGEFARNLQEIEQLKN